MKNKLEKILVKKIRSISNKNFFLALHEPSFVGKEIKYLKECIKSTFVSSIGNFIPVFENKIKKITKTKHVISTINGTSALQICLLSSGIKTNDEVLIPTLNYIASSNATLYCQAQPHFIDVGKESLSIDLLKLEKYLKKISIIKKKYCYNKKTGNRIYAIIPTHIFGHIENIDNLVKIANKFKLKIIEDSSEALGSYYKGRHAGTFALAGVLSFNGNKIITTGGGGAILTNSDNFAKKARHLISISRMKHDWKYNYDQIGYNMRMPNINAALGCAQIENLNYFLKKKRKLFKLYDEKFKKVKDITLYKETKNSKSNYWLQTILLKKSSFLLRDRILRYTNKHKINTRPVWKLMHKISYLKKFQKMNLSNANQIEKKIINLPSSMNLIND